MTRPRLIVIDKSPSSLVVYCTACTGWADVFTSKPAAYSAAMDHEIECHPEQFGMRQVVHKARARARGAQNVHSSAEDSAHGIP